MNHNRYYREQEIAVLQSEANEYLKKLSTHKLDAIYLKAYIANIDRIIQLYNETIKEDNLTPHDLETVQSTITLKTQTRTILNGLLQASIKLDITLSSNKPNKILN